MDTDLRQAGIERLISALDEVTADVQAHCATLSPAQLNWKLDAKEWSVGQCLDHLIVTNGTYRPVLSQIQAGTYRPALWQRLPGLPGFFGDLFYNTLNPTTARPVQSPPAFRPRSSTIPSDIVAQFGAQQDELIAAMRACANLPCEQIIIASPALALISYSLMDAFRIMTVHEQLHLGQLLRVIEHPDFPGASEVTHAPDVAAS